MSSGNPQAISNFFTASPLGGISITEPDTDLATIAVEAAAVRIAD